MADELTLPNLKSRVVIDSSALKVAEAEARMTGSSMNLSMGKGSAGTKLLSKDLQGLQKDTARAIPGLGGMGQSLGGLPVPALAAAAAIGAIVLVSRAAIEVSDKWEASQKGLTQATQASGVSNEKARIFVDGFINSNRKFISSQAEVVDSYAALTRQGLDQKTVQKDLGLALDLSALKHISLKDATTALQGAEAGRGKALITLGIQMKDYPILMETAGQAAVKLQKAEDVVTKATIAHTAAVKAHGAHSAQAKTTADALAKATEALAVAHDYAARRAEASTEIHDLLEKKLKGGRDTTSELTQTQNQLGNLWQTMAIKTGPALTSMLAGAEKGLIIVLEAIMNVINTMGTWKGLWEVLGKILDIFIHVWLFQLKLEFLIVKTVVLDIIDVVETLVGWFQKVVDVVKTVIDWLGKIKVPDIKLPFGIGGPAGRQFGGPVVPGQIYKINEQTPNSEYFSPAVPGTVIPNSGRRPASGGGPQVVQNFYNANVDALQVSREVAWVIR